MTPELIIALLNFATKFGLEAAVAIGNRINQARGNASGCNQCVEGHPIQERCGLSQGSGRSCPRSKALIGNLGIELVSYSGKNGDHVHAVKGGF